VRHDPAISEPVGQGHDRHPLPRASVQPKSV
jgi:hypothetical protein